jgi:hypothetical protein
MIGMQVTYAPNRAFRKTIPGIVWPPIDSMVTIYNLVARNMLGKAVANAMQGATT